MGGGCEGVGGEGGEEGGEVEGSDGVKGGVRVVWLGLLCSGGVAGAFRRRFVEIRGGLGFDSGWFSEYDCGLCLLILNITFLPVTNPAGHKSPLSVSLL